MNSLLHIAAFLLSLNIAWKFYDTYADDIIGLGVVIVVFWIGLLTILAVLNDVSRMIGRRDE